MSVKLGSVLVSCILMAAGIAQTSAHAEDIDAVLARVRSLESEVAAIRKENEVLRKIKHLREENAALANQERVSRSVREQQPSAISNPREAYAAVQPFYAKAAGPVVHGQMKVWGEGGATWTGGDPTLAFFNRTVVGSGTIVNQPDFLTLKPKLGWDAATGFDYRFSASRWHISGQFRYGEVKTSSSTSFVDQFSDSTTNVVATTSSAATQKETHWLADLAAGYDLLGNGPDAMQMKFGIRVAEYRAQTHSLTSTVVNIQQLPLPGLLFVESGPLDLSTESRFLGAGPRLGIDGSIPLGAGWSFDYLGDVAILFGRQTFQQESNGTFSLNGVPLNTVHTIVTDQKFATVFNTDIQAGLSYWVTDNIKISGSYRLDAYFNVLRTLDAKNDPTKLQPADRYIHGPRFALMAQF